MSNSSFNIADITGTDEDSQDRIVRFTLSDGLKSLDVSEECDSYFGALLTKPQVRKLIDRLEALYALMSDE